MEVKVVSNEMIKPSTPTLDHLRLYKLSFLDQITPKIYSPFIYFYSLNNHKGESKIISEISNKLKKSLSEALTLYYPLAGRFLDDYFLDCNDEGALYVEARVTANLSSIMENPDVLELNKLLSFKLDELADWPLGIQVNAFDCGGLALGVCLSHRLGDALSSLVFIQNWLAIARGDNDAIVCPEFISGDLFPSEDMNGYDSSFTISKGMCTLNTTKRFVFECPKIEALRTKFSKEENGIPRRVSRIEALSAFIWSRFANATKLAKLGFPAKEYMILHAVNIRPRCDPPLSNHSFGNYYTSSKTIGPISSACEKETCLSLTTKIGVAIRKIDKGFVEHIRVNGDEYFDSLKKGMARYVRGEVIGFFMSSLCRFPLYEADFGFGKPTWVSSSSRGFNNTVAMFDNKKGDGVEAYICLKPEDMAKLEEDKEFLSFVSPLAH